MSSASSHTASAAPGLTLSLDADSSRDSSPGRGSSLPTSAFVSRANTLYDELLAASSDGGSSKERAEGSMEPEPAATRLKLTDKTLIQGSFAYERGSRALWLDRHATLQRAVAEEATSSTPDAGSPSQQPQSPSWSPSAPIGGSGRQPLTSGDDCSRCELRAASVTPAGSPDGAGAATGGYSPAYLPTWAISQSMVWSLAQRYVTSHPPPPHSPSSPSQQQPTPQACCGDSTGSATAAAGTEASTVEAAPAVSQHPQQQARPLRALRKQQSSSAASCWHSVRRREAPPLPFGIGPVGMSAAQKQFRKVAIGLIAKGRFEMRKSVREVQQELAAANAAATCGSSTHATAADAAAAVSRAAAAAAATNAPTSAISRKASGKPGGGGLGHTVAHAVADTLAAGASPSARAAVRARVRAVVAGVSVAYAAANLGGCTDALMHVDFSNDPASACKAVLDFVTTAPSLGTIFADVMQIGVAVGLGVAQRRPPEL
ncbi:hypothetical protein HYH02_015042 [Chlamydomonas schloesseri]|uniref:Uncharacterized protein n=1 Tax=Chlamydomonas schloesseri TaxID=2026947 RepID=A0A835VRL2_9CHLO|nr:hypothetical protein HYH02_015042 [Chlamydomonas schloesseri]|eukprot:KAG2425215.1 hypothetical protein HYH02_015042 [Chlamydomonas schloesseri]